MSCVKKSSYLFRKVWILFSAILFMAFGASLYFKAGLGADPFSTLCDGLFRSTGLDRGIATLLVNGTIFVIFSLANRDFVNAGSIFAAFGVGPFITLFGRMLECFSPGTPGWIARLLLPLAGSLCIAMGRALYLPCNCGTAPFDMMILSLCKATKWSYKYGFICVSTVVFVIGMFLHATWGYGTLTAIFLTGTAADFLMSKWSETLKRFVMAHPINN